MRISVSEAAGRLADLVKRAEAGDEVILTRRGQEVGPSGSVRRYEEPGRPSGAHGAGQGLRRREGRPRTRCGAEPGLPLWRGRPAGMMRRAAARG